MNTAQPTPSSQRPSAFTLVEMLVVIALILILMAFLVPALTGIRGANDLTQGTEEIAGVLETARAYAIGANTYTWVGFYEHAPGTAGPYNSTPAYSGKGVVRVVAIASIDGTRIKKDTDSGAAIPSARIRPLTKVKSLPGIHLTDIGAPANSGGKSGSVDGRPGDPYSSTGSFDSSHYNRISSDSADKTLFPFTVADTTFYKTIRFNPLGESNINSSYAMRRFAEIGIVPTRGDQVVANATNTAAVQVSGITGEVEIYRK